MNLHASMSFICLYTQMYSLRDIKGCFYSMFYSIYFLDKMCINGIEQHGSKVKNGH